MSNPMLGAAKPMGPIEPHRLGIGVVAELHREDREGFQATKVLHIFPALADPLQQSGQVMDQGWIVTELENQALRAFSTTC